MTHSTHLCPSWESPAEISIPITLQRLVMEAGPTAIFR